MPDRPLLFGFRLASENPAHVRVQVFAGRNPGARGNAGTLTFRVDEWDEMRAAFLAGGFEEMPSIAGSPRHPTEHGDA